MTDQDDIIRNNQIISAEDQRFIHDCQKLPKYKDIIAQLIRERDEARAEIEFIRSRFGHGTANLKTYITDLEKKLAAETAKIEKMSAVIEAAKVAIRVRNNCFAKNEFEIALASLEKGSG